MKKQFAIVALSMFTVSFASDEVSSSSETQQQSTGTEICEISRPTCLHPKPWGGYTLSEMLEMRLCCLNGFVETFYNDIRVLNEKGLFAGKVKTYDPEIMKILHKIFTNEGRGETWSSITRAFELYPHYLFKDMDGLWALIKSRDTQPDQEVRGLLEKMRQPFRAAQWCATYYWNHRAEHFQTLKSSE